MPGEPTRVYGPDDRPLNAPFSRRTLDKVIGVLIAAVLFFTVAWGAIVWNATRAAELKNTEQDTEIKSIFKMQEKMDEKLDRIFDKVK